jgi:DNA-binding transcriptional LysR family regulator
MEIRVLKYFLMAAKEENITKAASLLHLTQPTLSRQLMQLEKELGVKLFKRSKHRIILTEDGIFLRRRAEEIISLAEKTKEDFLNKTEQLSGSVAVGSGELRSSRYLMRLISDFQKQNPLVRFTIYSGNSDNIKERIEHGLLDLGLLQIPVDITKYSYIRTPVREQWGVLLREDSLLADKKRITPKDLSGMSVIMPGRELVQNELRNWLSPYEEDISVIASGNLLYNMAILAHKTKSCVITLNLECHYSDMRFIPLSPAIESETVLAWKKTQVFSPAASAFIEYIQQIQ